MQHLSLPFFGLGFDLTQVVETARSMIFSRYFVPEKGFTEANFTPWGIDLLTFLSREIRGS